MIISGWKEYRKLAEKYDLIPVSREILADLDTPVSAFLKLYSGPYNFLLESAEYGERWGRYSFLSNDPLLVVRGTGKGLEVEFGGLPGRIKKGDLLDSVGSILKQYNACWDP
ncbi:MAG TPA: anthranilate synthase component I, partial [bacterium]|nr:anthranilate synthase component I [bacterium]